MLCQVREGEAYLRIDLLNGSHFKDFVVTVFVNYMTQMCELGFAYLFAILHQSRAVHVKGNNAINHVLFLLQLYFTTRITKNRVMW